MDKPVIGITASHNPKADGLALRRTYCNAVRAAGGIPLVLPLELTREEGQQLCDVLDGVLFSGGPDIHPFLFGEETMEGCGDASVLRDTMELSFFKQMYHAKKPLLGICRGVQLINIALGGNIYQDIRSQRNPASRISHNQPFDYGSPAHKVHITSGTLLAGIAGCETIPVNSLHHQAVREPADGLVVCGRASDGLIEALEKPDYPFLLGVQWHPEFMYQQHEHAENVFRAFTEACCSQGL